MKTTNRKKGFFRRAVAVITAMSLLLSVVFTQSAYAADTGKAAEAFSVPVSFGKITSAKYYNSDEIAISILDLHCHAEAQRNIAKIIAHLDKQYGIKNVYLEGAFGNVNTDMLTSLQNSRLGSGVLESLVDSGNISGTEYYSAVNAKGNFIKGIEDKPLYLKNIDLLNQIINVQPAVEAVCDRMTAELKPVKKEYSNADLRTLDRLVKRFEKKKISAKRFYGRLIKTAEEKGIDITKYANIKAYSELIDVSDDVNVDRISKQLGTFVNVLKSSISYGDYAALLEKSNNFSNLEEISSELKDISEKYQICETYKLDYLKNFLVYMEFNRVINPLRFAEEEKLLKEELYTSLGRDKYEQEVYFLSEFVPRIKGYFTAEITSDELSTFERDFSRFKSAWCSYFSENTALELDKYAQLLSMYHNNNLKRDEIFTKIISFENNKNTAGIMNEADALKAINGELKNKKIKVLVTGGFHNAGLEKIFNEKRISHIVITPKITKSTGLAHEIYLDTIKSYRTISENAINIKALVESPLNESLPKLTMAAFLTLNTHPEFKNYNTQQIQDALRDFVNNSFLQEYARANPDSSVSVKEWSIDSISKDSVKFTVAYDITDADGKTVGSIREFEATNDKVVELTQDGSVDVATSENLEKEGILSAVKNLSPYSLVDGFLKNKNSLAYKIITVFVMPILEEFVFKALPVMFFMSLPLSAPVALAAGLGVTLLTGAFLFPSLHSILDKIAVKYNPDAKIRTFKDLAPDSMVSTAFFLAMMTALPAAAIVAPVAALFISLIVPLVLHMSNNFGVAVLKLKGNVYSLADSFFGKKNARDAKKDENYNKNQVREYINILARDLGPAAYRGSREMPREVSEMIRSTIDEIRKAETYQNIDDQYNAVSQQLNNLYNELKKLYETNYSDPKKNASVRNAIIDDIISIIGYMSIASPYIMYGDTGKTLFEESTDLLVAMDSSKPAGQYSRSGSVYTQITRNAYLAGAKINPYILGKSTFYGIEKLKYLVNTAKFQQDGAYEWAYKYFPEFFIGTDWGKYELRDFFRELGADPKIDWDSQEITQYVPEIVKLLGRLPDSVFRQSDLLKSRSVIIRDKPKMEERDEQDDFDYNESFTEYNDMALAELSSQNRDSFKNTVAVIRNMLKILERFDTEDTPDAKAGETHAKAVRELNFIIDEYNRTGTADVNRVINIIHQDGIKKVKIKAAETGVPVLVVYTVNGGHRKISAPAAYMEQQGIDPEGSLIKIYDYSTEEIKPEVLEFLSGLHITGMEDSNFFLKNGKIIWDYSIGHHSFYSIIDLNNLDNGFTFGYNESYRHDGNRLRITMFAMEVAQLGMDIIRFDNKGPKLDDGSERPGVCGLQAVFRPTDKLSVSKQYADLLNKIAALMRNTAGLDGRMQGITDDDILSGNVHDGGRAVPEIPISDFSKLKGKAGWAPWDLGVPLGGQIGEEMSSRYRERLKPFFESGYIYDEVYDYLGIPETGRNFAEFERRYADGRIRVNPETGYLEKNESFKAMSGISRFLFVNQNEAFNQGNIIDLQNHADFSFRKEGDIGTMQAISGVLRIKEGYLSVEAVLNPETGRIECAYTEMVDFDGNRKPLSTKALINLLKENGYIVNIPDGRSKKAKNYVMDELRKENRMRMKGDEVNGMSVSEGIVSGEITYDQKNVGKNKIWAISQTIPDDINTIRNAGGILNSEGNKYSHISILIRETKTPAALMPTAKMINGKLEVTIQSVVGDSEKQYGFVTRPTEEKKRVLEEGDYILLDGTTGNVYIYDKLGTDTNWFMKEIDGVIERGDVNRAREIVDWDKNNENGEQIVEYIYKKCMAASPEISHAIITELSNSIDPESLAGRRIRALNESYMADLQAEAREMMRNAEKFRDEKKAYIVLRNVQRMFRDSWLNDRDIEGALDTLLRTKLTGRAGFKKELRALLDAKFETKKDIEQAVKAVAKGRYWKGYYGKEIPFMLNELEAKIRASIKNMPKSDTLLGLDELWSVDMDEFGSKSTEMGYVYRLLRDNPVEGVTVPYGVAIGQSLIEKIMANTEYTRLMAEMKAIIDANEAQARKLAASEKITLAEARKKAGEVNNREQAQKIAVEISNIIRNNLSDSYLEELGISKYFSADKKVAVRSSGVGEDGSEHAFAGMGETELNVDRADINANIREVLMSFFAERCIDYMLTESGQLVHPAVLVQEMVENVKKAGQIFTANRKGDTEINAVAGLGEGAVSGRVMADTITIKTSAGTIEYRKATDRIMKIVPNPEGGTIAAKLTKEEKTNRVLFNDAIYKLKQISDIIENDFGYPVDIEFAIGEDDTVYILQVRPITTFVDNSDAQPTHNIAVEYKSQAELDKMARIANVENPEQKESSVPVYYDNKSSVKDNNLIVFYVNENLKGQDRAALLASLAERIETDEKVRASIPISAAITAASILGIDPLYQDLAAPDTSAVGRGQNNQKATIRILASA